MKQKLLFFLMMFLTGANLSAQNGGYALKFDGADDYVETNYTTQLNTFTIECWVKGDAAPGSADVSGVIHRFKNFELNWDHTNIAGRGAAAINIGGGDNDWHFASFGPLNANEWYHLAATYDGATLKSYKNGTLITSNTNPSGYPTLETNTLKLGSHALPGNGHFGGMLDEVRVWNIVRSEAEIKASMFKELAGSESGLQIYYKMSNGTGTSLTDNSGNNNTGTLTNGPEWKLSGCFAGTRQALDFDGTNEYVNITNGVVLGTTFTQEMWIYPTDATQNYRGIIGKQPFNYYQRPPCIWQFGQKIHYGFGTGTEFLGGITPDVLTINTWNHVAVSFDGTTYRIYVNGLLVYTSLDNAGKIPNALGQDELGKGDQAYFQGKMDEVRIWTIVRTEAEIRESMMRTLDCNETGLAAYYRMDQYDGTTLYNMASGSHNGVLTNMDPATDWVPSTAFNSWLGGESNAWSNVVNWSNGVPTAPQSIGLYKWNLANITTYEATVSGSPIMNNLLISSGSAPTLSSGLTVNGNLLLGKDMNLNGQTVTLGPQGYLVEGNGYFSGPTGMISTTRTLSNITAQNVGGLGAILTSAASMGSTVISRGHAAQSGNVKSGILRYYNITPATNTGLNATLVFNYSDQELNGLTEADFKLYKSTDAGSTWWGMGGTLSTVDNQVTLGNIGSFSRWTVSDGIMSCANPTDGGLIAGAQTICYGADPAAFTSSAPPTGHNGTLECKWQYSTTGSPFSWNDIASSNSEVYDAQALTQTTWYRRLARVSCMADWSGAVASNVVEVTVIALPTVTDLLLTPNLDITRFDNYELSVNVNPNGSSIIDDVTFVTRPQTASASNMQWDFYPNGVPFPDPNVPLVNAATFTSGNAWSFSQLRPDNIYSEIAFIFDISAPPSNSRFWQNSYELMRFTNNYEVTPNTSFFIELYATPKTTAPFSVDLQVYLVGKGFNISDFQTGGPLADEIWQNHASVELVGTINQNYPFHHTHGANSKHFLVPLSADVNGKIGNKGLDINDDFWIILTTGNHLETRGWDMKYHNNGCNNNGTWYKGSGNTFALQSGCPDVHVHFAREETTPVHNAMEVYVAVEYSSGSQHCVFKSANALFYFDALPNLPPNASSFILPAPGTYQGDVTISWYPATDPNNDPVTYNVYLINDAGTVTHTLATGHATTSYTLNTTSYDNGDYDILVEACDVAFCTGFTWSSDIDDTEFFRILNCTLVAGAITDGDGQAICSGGTPLPITAAAPTGGGGTTFGYQWQQLDGATWVSVTGGSGENTLTYTPPVLTTTAVYRLQQTDTWCDPVQVVETAEVTVTVTPLPTFTFAKTDISCFAGNDGAITITASGGSESGYQYSINNGSSWQFINVFTNLQAGDYPLKVKDDAGCMSENLLIN
jgi:hypothetical protein